MCIIISIANIMQTLLISGLKMMIMLLWPCLNLRHKPLPSSLEIDVVVLVVSPKALFSRHLVFKLASGGKIPPPVFLFSPLFRGYFFPTFMLLRYVHSSSAHLAFPVTFTSLTFDAISFHINFSSWKQPRQRNSVLKIPFFIFSFLPTSYVKLDTALRRHLYTMFDNVRLHRLLSVYVYLLNGHNWMHSNKISICTDAKAVEHCVILGLQYIS